MDNGFGTDRDYEARVEAIAADMLADRARASGRSVQDEVSDVRRQARALTVEEKLALSAELRAMTPEDCRSEDSTLILRWYRDTNGGRWTDDGWDDAGR